MKELSNEIKTIVLMCLFMLGLFSGTAGQDRLLDRPVQLEQNVGEIRFFLKEIENQSDIKFLYDNSKIPVNKVKELPQKASFSVKELLALLFSNENVAYQVLSKNIILKQNVRQSRKKGKATIRGYIKDAQSGENLIGGHVIDINSRSGSTSNYYSFYSLTLPIGEVNLAFTYVGYSPQNHTFFLKGDTSLNIHLGVDHLDEVIVSGQKPMPIQETTEMGTVRMTSDQVKDRPAIGGEVDVIKALQLLPGVQSGREGSSGLYVRGGGPDQNLILLDGVPIYNVSHLFGFMSVFDANAINNVKLVKGAFPARYGGRLSSVVDISMKEGNLQKFQGSGSIGLIASKMTLEGPIKKDTTSFIISARRTYLDMLVRPFIRSSKTTRIDGTIVEEDPDGAYYFYDLNGKVNHKFSNKDRLYFSIYSGRDVGFADLKTNTALGARTTDTFTQNDLRWGSTIGLLRWNHVVNHKLFSNVSLSYSSYDFKSQNQFLEQIRNEQSEDSDFQHFSVRSGIRDWSGKIDFDFFPNPNHTVKFGASTIAHKFSPNIVALRSQEASDTTFNSGDIRTTEYILYMEDDIRLSDRIRLNVGLHFSASQVLNSFYTSLQPRFSLNYMISGDLAFKASYSRMTQFLSLLTNPGIGLPTDFWVPSTDKVKPQQGQQYSMGLAYTHPVHEFEISVEGYYKTMDNLIEYKEGAGFLRLDEDWQDKVETGKGKSYGVEVFVRKKFGSTDGWIGYTWSRSDRQFENLNFGQTFPFKYDRRHDVSAVLDHHLTKKIKLSANWVYGTGTALTLPQSTYDRPSDYEWRTRIPHHYSGRNAYRMRAYHRLDLSISFHKTKAWGEREWVISIYNAYSRRNPFYVEQRATRVWEESAPDTIVFREVTWFPIIPSFSYRVKF